MSGFVSLVGAGPGDPELLTMRALDRLKRADLVLNDALVPEVVTELAPKAKRFYVGKRAGRHSIDQDGIHKLMVIAAKRGQRVVRLKAGDPFVFGRGGEEALALEAAHVAYEIVPGISSALAASPRRSSTIGERRRSSHPLSGISLTLLGIALMIACRYFPPSIAALLQRSPRTRRLHSRFPFRSRILLCPMRTIG